MYPPHIISSLKKKFLALNVSFCSCVLLIFFNKATTSSSIKTTHHIGSTNRFNCIGKTSGFYADPNSCTQYFICAGTQSFEVSCASGLLFNDATKFCDWPYNVRCNAQQIAHQTTTRAPVPTNPPQTTHAHGTQHVTTTTTQAPYIPNLGKINYKKVIHSKSYYWLDQVFITGYT